jgi:hypothetical protein
MKEIGRAVLTIPVFTRNVDYDEVKAAMTLYFGWL